ncbi:NAD-dependent epimerase/dehydratase family protein [Halalkalibacter urbisdiaboli]|uniref:NAD-dependent epimerase/dehydratase family protein n=1 Tax=Halalkalibacter urbisdiaboli TaxID=1960589 RepID=UPI000B42E98B|nr:SDR family NAD(P)-dependent oxidoreductase [Halalkalibacter urbisdiaboli]
MKKVVVTGGMGFIGFHLCKRLLEEGIEVIAIDEMPSERREQQEEMHLRIGRNALFQLINKKIEDVDNLHAMLSDVDVVFHLAAKTKYDSKWTRLAEVIEQNVKVTQTLLNACHAKTRFIYASTIEVYGARPGLISERTPTNPTSPYGITKLASESIIKEKNNKKVPYMILRLPTVYGPWQRDDMTYQRIMEGVEKELITYDRTTLDLVYVEDVVDAFILAATTDKKNEIIQIASGDSEAWFKAVNKLGCHKFEKREPAATLSTEKAASVLGFKTKTTIDEGLAKQRQHMTQWQKQQGL